MKLYFTILLLAIASMSKAQNSILGKWKPVFFSLGGEVIGNLTESEPEIRISLDSMVKNDKDPEGSKAMLKKIYQIMFDKTKALTEEYKPNGEFIETDSKSGRAKTGNYIINTENNEMVKSYSGSTKKTVFKIQWKENKFSLISMLNSKEEKKAELIVTYEKL